ncbi:MAG: peroxiredoxin family protein [candidate division NC10 bacterium]|nr:peroxiredoxin family protein [candidate division NC10 bacterium]
MGTQVVALSVDSEEDAQKMVDRHKLTFPVLYGLNAREIVATIGGYINEEPLYLHPSGFILRQNGTIVLLVQSSGAIGRLVANDTLGLIQHYQEQGK